MSNVSHYNFCRQFIIYIAPFGLLENLKRLMEECHLGEFEKINV